MTTHGIPDYGYRNAHETWAHQYLDRPVFGALVRRVAQGGSVFELGCGNGSFSAGLAEKGFRVTAVDPSESGIRLARATFPKVSFACASTDDDLASRFGRFDAVISLEVLEHCYAPRQFAKRIFECLKDDGLAVISTPYHGYWKNLALAVSGRLERHLNPLWDGGHIKFFSGTSLTELLHEAGFTQVEILRVGRFPPAFAKSMIAIARRPLNAGRSSTS